jgi:hypothetical protein
MNIEMLFESIDSTVSQRILIWLIGGCGFPHYTVYWYSTAHAAIHYCSSLEISREALETALLSSKDS